MAKKPFTPPTLAECEAYAREKGLLVDPEFFFNYFDAAEWHDSNDKAVRSWKQKMWTWHRMVLERGGAHKCFTCGKAGVYIVGKNRDGHPYYYCHNHKPKPKPAPVQVQEMAKGLFKSAPKPPNRAMEINRQKDILEGRPGYTRKEQ